MEKFCASLFHPKFFSAPAIVHGRTYEKAALEKFSVDYGKKLTPCGLFIHEQFPFLAATPDSLVEGESSIVEVKCPYSIRDELISSDNLDYLDSTEAGLHLKKTHKYFYQIMGQLILTKKEKCYFVVFTFNDMHVEEIFVDNSFFFADMLPRLEHFYVTFYRQYVEEQAVLFKKRDIFRSLN